jgi:hypothetical protein
MSKNSTTKPTATPKNIPSGGITRVKNGQVPRMNTPPPPPPKK